MGGTPFDRPEALRGRRLHGRVSGTGPVHELVVPPIGARFETSLVAGVAPLSWELSLEPQKQQPSPTAAQVPSRGPAGQEASLGALPGQTKVL